MLSRQKTNSLFNDRYLREAERKRVIVEQNVATSTKVRITSKRIDNRKYYQIDLPSNNILHKKHLILNLNTVPRPNYKNGSLEMYRAVNGLCQVCGHDHFIASIAISKTGYVLSKIVCGGCHSRQPWDYVHTFNVKNVTNRGKSYAEKKYKQSKRLKSNNGNMSRNKNSLNL